MVGLGLPLLAGMGGVISLYTIAGEEASDWAYHLASFVPMAHTGYLMQKPMQSLFNVTAPFIGRIESYSRFTSGLFWFLPGSWLCSSLLKQTGRDSFGWQLLGNLGGGMASSHLIRGLLPDFTALVDKKVYEHIFRPLFTPLGALMAASVGAIYLRANQEPELTAQRHAYFASKEFLPQLNQALASQVKSQGQGQGVEYDYAQLRSLLESWDVAYPDELLDDAAWILKRWQPTKSWQGDVREIMGHYSPEDQAILAVLVVEVAGVQAIDYQRQAWFDPSRPVLTDSVSREVVGKFRAELLRGNKDDDTREDVDDDVVQTPALVQVETKPLSLLEWDA